MFDKINLLAVLAASASAFLLGSIWYSPLLFGHLWLRETGLNPEQMRKGHRKLIFVSAFIAVFIAAYVFAFALPPKPAVLSGTIMGAAIGTFWVATSFAINYLFAHRSLKLFLVDAGYHILQFTLYGLILCLWQ